MTSETMHDGQATRRAMLAGAGLVGVATLAACSSNSSSTAAALPTDTASSSAGAATGGSASGSTTSLGAASQIPVGGGKVFAAEKVVVTQPSAGEYKGFSAVCTHMQCLVDQVANGTIDCPCHGSEFSIKDGSVVAGPAPSPLPAAPVTVSSSGEITLS